jgi:hypothetical protein
MTVTVKRATSPVQAVKITSLYDQQWFAGVRAIDDTSKHLVLFVVDPIDKKEQSITVSFKDLREFANLLLEIVDG